MTNNIPGQQREVALELLGGPAWAREWAPIGGVSEAEPPGSLASDGPDGRQVYLFGWLPDGTGPGVWRSRGGVDVATPVVREVVTAGLDQIADLTEGTHEQDLIRPGGRMRVRFQLKGSPR